MTDIVERLARIPEVPDEDDDFTPELARDIIRLHQAIAKEAHAEIERLRAERDEWKQIAEDWQLANPKTETAFRDQAAEIERLRALVAGYERGSYKLVMTGTPSREPSGDYQIIDGQSSAKEG